MKGFIFNNGISVILTLSVLGGINPNGSFRRASDAGSFYPGDKNALKKMLDYFFAGVKTNVDCRPYAIIVPHAGYVYSGQTAAYDYSVLEGKPIERVILLATAHYAYLNTVVVNELPYKTPAGLYDVDRKAIDLLKREKFPYSTNNIESEKEHSDEVQIPFLQRVLPKARLVPIIVGNLSDKDLTETALALEKILDDKTVIVVSSDFTHYGSNYDYKPSFNGKSIKDGIKDIDNKAIDFITNKDSSGFRSYIQESGATICGSNPIALLLKILELQKYQGKGVLLNYMTSGDLTGSFDNSVSYAAILFGDIKSITPRENLKPKIDKKLINEEEEVTLLKLSRFALTKYIEYSFSDFTDKNLSQFNITIPLKQNLGVFVTLKKKEELRGCIGYIQGIGPLYESVIQNTINASTKDPRFPAVTKNELKEIEIEVSVMTPLVKINSIDEIVIGRDGLYLKNGYNSGVFLPQVPLEWGWDIKTYLEELCLKAGLPENTYNDKNTEIYRFSAQVFSERR